MAVSYSSRLQRSILAPAVLRPLRLMPTSSEFPDGARHLFAMAYVDGERNASLRARAALTNRPVTIRS